MLTWLNGKSPSFSMGDTFSNGLFFQWQGNKIGIKITLLFQALNCTIPSIFVLEMFHRILPVTPGICAVNFAHWHLCQHQNRQDSAYIFLHVYYSISSYWILLILYVYIYMQCIHYILLYFYFETKDPLWRIEPTAAASKMSKYIKKKVIVVVSIP